MKSNFLVLAFIFISISHFSQTPRWGGEQREMLYNQCVRENSIQFEIFDDKRKELCLCFLYKIEKSYSQKQYSELITVELDKIQSDAINKCSEELKIRRSSQSPSQRYSGPGPVTIVNLNKENIYGIWEFPSSRVLFLNDMRFRHTGLEGKITSGYWSLKDKTIYLDGLPNFIIEYFDGGKLSYQYQDSNNNNTIRGSAVKVNKETFILEDLFGDWQDENSTITFQNNFQFSSSQSGRTITGQWGLDGRRIYFKEKHRKYRGLMQPMDILEFDGNKFKYKQEDGNGKITFWLYRRIN